MSGVKMADGTASNARKSNVPVFKQAGDHLAAEIMGGAFRDETKLPSVKDLALEYKVSTATMQRVLRDLAGQGLVRGVRGSGTFITRNSHAGAASQELRVAAVADMFSREEAANVCQRFREAAPRCELTWSEGAADVLTMRGDDIPALGADLSDVTDLVEEVYARDANDRQLFNSLHFAGRHLMLPALLYTTTVACNKDLFKRAGVPLPRPGWTWEDFRDAASALTRRQADQYGFCPSQDMGMLFQAAIWQEGGRVFSRDGRRCLIDQAPARRFAEMVRQLRPFAPPDPQFDLWSGNRHRTLFARGQVAMTVAGNWFPWRLHRDGGRVTCRKPASPNGPWISRSRQSFVSPTSSVGRSADS